MSYHFFCHDSLGCFSLLFLVLWSEVFFQDLGLQGFDLDDCVLCLFVLLFLDANLSILGVGPVS